MGKKFVLFKVVYPMPIFRAQLLSHTNSTIAVRGAIVAQRGGISPIFRQRRPTAIGRRRNKL